MFTVLRNPAFVVACTCRARQQFTRLKAERLPQGFEQGALNKICSRGMLCAMVTLTDLFSFKKYVSAQLKNWEILLTWHSNTSRDHAVLGSNMLSGDSTCSSWHFLKNCHAWNVQKMPASTLRLGILPKKQCFESTCLSQQKFSCLWASSACLPTCLQECMQDVKSGQWHWKDAFRTCGASLYQSRPQIWLS